MLPYDLLDVNELRVLFDGFLDDPADGDLRK